MMKRRRRALLWLLLASLTATPVLSPAGACGADAPPAAAISPGASHAHHGDHEDAAASAEGATGDSVDCSCCGMGPACAMSGCGAPALLSDGGAGIGPLAGAGPARATDGHTAPPPPVHYRPPKARL